MNEFFHQATGEPLSNLHQDIFRRAWENYTYEEMGLGYSLGHIREEGSKLFRVLGQKLGQPVNKRNFRAVLSNYAYSYVHSESVSQETYGTLIQKRIPGTAQYYSEPLGDTTTLEMVLIPGGSFLMGSPEDEPERMDREGPQHEVTVPSFFMGRYPVTQAQWRWVAGLSPINQELDPDPAHFKGDHRPVEQVSWHDAVEFCARVSAHTGRPYRLPSEAEWEYACRAETMTPFHFGETITTDLANYDGNYTYNDGPKGEYRKETTPVDQFGIANAFGLCEMHGNVWEWCADHWHDSYEGATIDGSAWVDQDVGEDRSYVLRGGSWSSLPMRCRSASRNLTVAGARNFILGFRVVCSAPRLFPSP
ncbi:formylglycine-generating enzyme family protein [Alkalinema sp. FACHB-956]|uniref:formylglycine-generating enzyme family protein n=1 Tax=Alkalinema sp. FACHB-956 TaxID=2692768 RepID=UPI001F550C06|nr:formylglycine-generating enzyme family protein [Alkalinema sp. FACHB-956]